MEEIIKTLEEITKKELNICKNNKKIPSEETLSIVKLIMSYHMSR